MTTFKYHALKLKHILTDKKYDNLADEYPYSVNYTQYRDSLGRSRIYSISRKKYMTYCTFKHHMQIYNLNYQCIIELTNRQNNILKAIVNDEELLHETECSITYTEKGYDISEDICIIL